MSFTPANLSGQILWLDASDATTLTNSDVASPPALGNIADGSTVGTWFDKSGAGNHFSMTTSGSRPAYKTSGGQINSHAYVKMSFAQTQVDGSGPYLSERGNALSGVNALGGSNTVLILMHKYGTNEASYQVIFTNNGGGPGGEFLLRYGQKFERFNVGSTLPFPAGTRALTYSFNSSNNKETFYLDSAATEGFSSTGGRPSLNGSPFTISDGGLSANSEYYEVIAYNRELSNSEIAQVYAYWNDKYGTTFNASAGPLTAPTPTASNATKTTQTVSASSPVGGTSPYTYQWYRSTANGSAASIAVSGNAVSGATSLVLNDTGLTVQTPYYYVLKITDAASTTVLTSVLTARTHGNTTIKFGFFGDSITFGASSGTDPVTQFGLALQATYPHLDVQVTNYGGSGEKFRTYSRLAHPGGESGQSGVTGRIGQLNTAGINYVCIMEGTNDWNAGTDAGVGGSDTTFTANNYKADMEDVIAALTAAGKTVYINQLLWRSTTNADDATIGIRAWNTKLAALTYNSTVRQGDTTAYTYFKNHPSELGDGLHPNSQGSTTLGGLWATAIGPTLAENQFPPTFTSATINSTGTTLSLVFSESVTGVSAADYAITGSHTLSSVSGSGSTRTMTIDPPVNSSETIKINYTGTATKNGTNNSLLTFSNVSVINNSTVVPPSTGPISISYNITTEFSEGEAKLGHTNYIPVPNVLINGQPIFGTLVRPVKSASILFVEIPTITVPFTVTLVNDTPNSEIHYKFNGKVNHNSPVYTGPILVDGTQKNYQSLRFKVYAINNGQIDTLQSSKTVVCKFYTK